MMRFDLHVHSNYSFDSLMSVGTIIKAAKKKNLDGVAITDHNTISGGKKACQINESQLLIIVGSEIATDIGDIIGLFLSEDIKYHDSLEVMDQIKSQGGVSVFPHPFKGHKLTNHKTIEVLKRIDCIETCSSRAPITAEEYQFLDSLSRVQLGGSDAHFPAEIGLCHTIVDVDTVDVESVKDQILSGRTVPVGMYGPQYFQTLSQIVKSVKTKKFKPLIPLAFSLVKGYGKQGRESCQTARKNCILPENPEHHGVILNPSSEGFDKGGVAFGSVFLDEDDPNTLLLFYTGAQDIQWSHSDIGLASSKNGIEFQKVGDPLALESASKSFFSKEVLAPVVTKIGNRFYMVFSGKDSWESPRRLGIAYADDPKGSWHIIGEIIRPFYLWEGADIDNGPSIVKLNHDTILAFYSNITSWKWYDIFTMWRRYPVRRIGVIKIRIRGTSKSSIEVHRFSGNPLKHLNGPKGSWNESLFCPGHFQLQNMHYLLPSASTYSTRFPYRQYIGVVASNSPYFLKSASRIQKLLDGPSEKMLIMPNIKGEMALDSPAPFLKAEKGKLFLYYSVMDQADRTWKIALTAFSLRGYLANFQKA